MLIIQALIYKRYWTTYQEKMRKATDNCLLAVADLYWSLDQTQMQPPSKLAIIWARDKRIRAASPNWKAWWLGYLQSNIHIFIGFSCFHMPKEIKNKANWWVDLNDKVHVWCHSWSNLVAGSFWEITVAYRDSNQFTVNSNIHETKVYV